jgi:hypothetical protein
MRETTSHYAVLGVSETASVEEIRAGALLASSSARLLVVTE